MNNFIIRVFFFFFVSHCQFHLIALFLCKWSLQLQTNIQGSFLICQKKHFRWFFLRSLIRTWGTPCNLELGYTMQVWMTRIDLLLRNFLQTTRFRQNSYHSNIPLFLSWSRKRKISSPFSHWCYTYPILGFGLYQHIGMGCEPSSSSGYYQGEKKLSTVFSLWFVELSTTNIMSIKSDIEEINIQQFHLYVSTSELSSLCSHEPIQSLY